MKYPSLRRLTSSSLNSKKLAAIWSNEGVVLHKQPPAPDAVLMVTTLVDGTKVYIDLRNWLEQAMPEKSQLRFDLLEAQDIQNYFYYSNATLKLKLTGLDEDLTNFLPCKNTFSSVLAIELNNIWFWFESIPLGCFEAINQQSKKIPESIASLPFKLKFMLGSSLLSAKYLTRLKTGDVLLINEEKNEIMIENEKFSNFINAENGYILDNQMNEGHSECTHSESKEFKPVLSGTQHIPVKLHFVVHERTVSLQQLTALQTGDVFECAQDGRQNIDIFANGCLIAEGELIMIDEKLGVVVNVVK